MKNPDRLYELLPAVYRQRDAEQGYPLKALLRVIAEQVDVVESDINQLYENWFIETCEDWVVPYLGDLIGYRPVHEAGEPGDPHLPAARALNKILIPRRDVANTIHDRRRKGTLALLELLANDVAIWPARAVEFYRLLAWFQHLDHQHPHRGRTVDLRDGDALDLLDGPFDRLAHTVDIRRVNSQRTQGRYNIPSLGVFVWRLKSYSVTKTRAHYLDENPHCYTFSVLGNDAPLYIRPISEAEPTHIAEEMSVPAPIRRLTFERRKSEYYGEGKSVQVWVGSPNNPIPVDKIVAADLTNWHYRPAPGKVAIDPVLGRMVFPQGHSTRKHVWVSYQYGFSAEIGGGEYERRLSQRADAVVYRASDKEELRKALLPWQRDQEKMEQPAHAVIEITDSGVYVLPINLTLQPGHTLQLRAANGTRPVIRLLDWETDLGDALSVTGGKGSRFTLDGLYITGRGLQIYGSAEETETQGAAREGDLCDVTIRHCTLVPGWGLHCDCEPHRPEEASVELCNTTAQLKIEHSIIGSIEVTADQAQSDPVQITLSDSVLDATDPECEALSGPGCTVAYAKLTILRSTVFGKTMTHAVGLAENCIFMGHVMVARRQTGCVRFCYVTPGSRTPRRYECQPDLVRKVVTAKFLEAGNQLTAAERDAELAAEELRVEPEFNSTRYGTPTYCQLADTCAEEITRGADDESEMGAFHDLFQPQRAANLRARLDEYTPAGMDAGIIYAT